MRFFNKSESVAVIIIFSLVFFVTTFNLRISLRRARDVQRRSDIANVANALEKFYSEYGFFPPEEGGKIKFCKGSNFDSILSQVNSKDRFDKELFFQGLRPCEWGKDLFVDVINQGEKYLESLPSDPKTANGFRYYYLSNTKRYQLYSFLEGNASEIGYDSGIVERNLSCGSEICSFGWSYAGTPLDKSIEEYEAELLQKGKI